MTNWSSLKCIISQESSNNFSLKQNNYKQIWWPYPKLHQIELGMSGIVKQFKCAYCQCSSWRRICKTYVDHYQFSCQNKTKKLSHHQGLFEICVQYLFVCDVWVQYLFVINFWIKYLFSFNVWVQYLFSFNVGIQYLFVFDV